MEKTIKKIVTLCLCSIVAFGCVGCGEIGGVSDKDSSTVQMYVWDSGFGVDWITEIVNEYNAKQTTYKVELETTSNMNTITSSLGASVNPYDLYITGVASCKGTVENMADLTSVLDSTYEGESKTIRQKMKQYDIDRNTYNGKFNSFTLGAQVQGIIYNAELFDTYSLEEPKTSKELENLAWQIQYDDSMVYDGDKKIAPFIHYKDTNNGDWKSIYEVWVGQYLGLTGYQDLVKLKDSNGTDQKNVWLGNSADGTSNKENDARYKVLKALESILTVNTVHTNSNELSFTDMQTKFLGGQSVMYVSGSHLKGEMSVVDDFNFKMMKTPVFSDIVEKLEYREGNSYMTDAQLSKIISSIDAGKDYANTKTDTGLNNLSESDYNRIKEARAMDYGRVGDAGQLVFVPTSSNAIDASKDFLKYMYSDAGAEAWMKTQHTEFAVELQDKSLIDTSNYGIWENSINEIIKTRTVKLGGGLDASKLFVNNGKDIFANVNIIMNLTAKNPSDRGNADTIWSEMQQIINSNWHIWENA